MRDYFIRKKLLITVCVALVLHCSACTKNYDVEDENVINSSTNNNTYENEGIVNESYDFVEDNSISLCTKEIEDANVGDIVSFGYYEQNTDLDGGEAILWDVLDEKDGNILLISHYVIDQISFSTGKSNPGWGKSYVRVWLNNDFYINSFDENEKKRIILSNIENPSSAEMYEMCGEDVIDRKLDDTEDYIFLLSWKEAFEYYDVKLVEIDKTDSNKFKSDEVFYSNKLIAKPSPYCKEKIYEKMVKYREEIGDDPSQVSYQRTAGWLLRSDAQIQLINMRVSEDGEIIGVSPNSEYGIRPAMWVKKSMDE